MPKILLIEDDEILADQITKYLIAKHHIVETCMDGKEATELLEVYKYDLIIIDWGLPGVTGVEIVKNFRRAGGVTPILMLTGRNRIEEKEVGFDSGADDYVTKPFDIRELSSRVQALLRRAPEFQGARMEVSGIVVDSGSHQAFFRAQPIALQPKEFALLEFLIRHKGKAVRTKDLLDHVWGSDSDVTSETLYTYMRALRKKIQTLGGDPNLIATVHGVGYSLRVSAADS